MNKQAILFITALVVTPLASAETAADAYVRAYQGMRGVPQNYRPAPDPYKEFYRLKAIRDQQNQAAELSRIQQQQEYFQRQQENYQRQQEANMQHQEFERRQEAFKQQQEADRRRNEAFMQQNEAFRLRQQLQQRWKY